VAGHAACDRVNTEAHIDTTLSEGVIQLANLVLRLRHRHAVARNNSDPAGSGKNRGSLFGSGALDWLSLLLSGHGSLDLPKSAEKHVGERPIHRFRHNHRKNETRRTVQSSGYDEQLAVEHKAHGSG